MVEGSRATSIYCLRNFDFDCELETKADWKPYKVRHDDSRQNPKQSSRSKRGKQPCGEIKKTHHRTHWDLSRGPLAKDCHLF